MLENKENMEKQLFAVDFIKSIEIGEKNQEYLDRKEEYKNKLIAYIDKSFSSSEFEHFQELRHQIGDCIQSHIDNKTIDYYYLFVGGTMPEEQNIEYEDVEFKITPLTNNDIFNDREERIFTIKTFIDFLYDKYFPNGVSKKEESTYSSHSW